MDIKKPKGNKCYNLLYQNVKSLTLQEACIIVLCSLVKRSLVCHQFFTIQIGGIKELSRIDSNTF